MSFAARLAAAVRRTRTPLCVGIDPHLDRLPGADPADTRADRAARALRFGRAVVSACAGRVPIVKPQFAFFEALGPEGMGALATVCAEAREAGLLVLGDAKRGDIGSTAAAYASATLGPDAPFPCDALTVSPFLGPESLEPFLDRARAGSGLFVLARTSNPGSDTFQRPVADTLARWLGHAALGLPHADGFGPVGAVVGATHPDELGSWRRALPHSWLLLPGYGAQGATARDTLPAFRADGLGALVVSARAATFPDGPDATWAEDPAAWIASRVEALKADLATAWSG